MEPTPSSSPRLSRLVLALGIVFLLLGLGALVAAALSSFNAPAPTPTPSSAAAPAQTPAAAGAVITPAAASAAINRLAVIDSDQIYTIAPDGTDRIDFQASGHIPTAALIWSRTGQRLIYAEIEGSASRLVSARPDGSDAVRLYEGTEATAPFYLDGAPNDAHVAFLVPDPDHAMALRLAPIDQAKADRVAVTGQPNYASWSPDGSALVVHIGGISRDAFIGTYALSQTQVTKLQQTPAAFQAPGWSPEGEAQLLYARTTDSSNELVVDNGRETAKLANFDDGIAFSWSPDGQLVAYTLNTPDSFLYRGLYLIDRAGNHQRMLYRSDILAFFWSPNGKHLAFLTGALVQPGQIGRASGLAAPRAQQPSTLQTTWHVADVDSGEITDFGTFEPTDSFLYLIQYFDQFAQSIALWSPDSRWLIYAGRPLVGAPGVYLLDTQQAAAAPRLVGSGDFAIWSWK